MEKLTEARMCPLPASPYVKPFRMRYTQNGQSKDWDLLEVHDSVAIIIFNITRRTLVFVKQFRPAVYFNCLTPQDRLQDRIDVSRYPASLGVTLELCAGIIDKDIPVAQIACEEILEECGYKVKPNELQFVQSYRAGVGVQGSLQTLFYCEVSDDMKVSAGGGVDGEMIDVVEMSIPEVERYLAQPGPLASPPSALYGLSWFLLKKAARWRKPVDPDAWSM